MPVIPFPSSASAMCRTVAAAPDTIVPRASASALSRPALWLRRWRGRRALAALDRDQIRDADLDPFAVRLEAMKPFWRA
jgi:uncharacterized protein YjiS (DUF1127 family)